MERSRRVALVAHCLLNANSKVEGLAEYEGIHPVIAELASRGYGVIQLPCPELGVEGLAREPRSLEHYDTPIFREHCRILAQPIIEQVREYLASGYEVGTVIGIEGSPSCGVAYTSSETEPGESERVPGSGVWIDVLREALEPLGIAFVATDHREPEGGVALLDL